MSEAATRLVARSGLRGEGRGPERAGLAAAAGLAAVLGGSSPAARSYLYGEGLVKGLLGAYPVHLSVAPVRTFCIYIYSYKFNRFCR